MTISNEKLKNYPFLAEMTQDAYFPPHLVAKGQQLLLDMCATIEAESPQGLTELYAITQATTDDFNALAEEFEENGSEIETAARDCIGTDFAVIASAYGFDADIEELIATRDW
ncbi:hypothetical protein BK634_14805 [Pseudomonas chlororaphis]|jgi:hypothetical protein|uniref:DUF5713 family protein n=1 Tax=Pseudomonas morbosilactucae TaxID=2938197 RepID=A0A9X1YTZ9_9PSED|nr:DUF5713 family protein [Pseudomonas morbosilactucae]MCK9798183.1 DUF5713 family protein [Pseudomonas morbosilactucae]MCK9815025.1 DUF5713 family protein [Pseudomonas morbosilactucae]ROL69033.1 hypothetical protein BK634_14805 [Pseudomonas chlororaphis]WEK11847.1 MAG: DUF5713 family protein [Pseudomonas sp.]